MDTTEKIKIKPTRDDLPSFGVALAPACATGMNTLPNAAVIVAMIIY